MLAEDPIKLDGIQREPTASQKSFRLETTQQDSDGYKTKPIPQWKYEDVVNFVFDGRKNRKANADFDFAMLSGTDGSKLVKYDRSFFERFSKKFGAELYEEVQKRAREDEASLRSYKTTTTTAATTTTTSSSSPPFSTPSPLFPQPFVFTTDPNVPNTHHIPPQPSVVCDAQAPYELRIEPPPQKYHRDLDRYSLTHVPPSPPSKPGPPPLMAMESGGREGRGGGSSEGAGGGGTTQGQRTEEVKVEPPKKRGPGRPKKPENELKKKKKKTGRLWEFIRNLLLNPETCPSLVRWENADEGLFRFVDGEKVAKRWGSRKGNEQMNYEKLSRAMRYYYKTHIFEAVIGRRLVYKFGKKATNWRPSNPNFADLNPTTSPHPTTQEPQPPPQISFLSDPEPTPPPAHRNAHHHTQFLTSQLLHRGASPPPPPQPHHIAHHIQGLTVQPHHTA